MDGSSLPWDADPFPDLVTAFGKGSVIFTWILVLLCLRKECFCFWPRRRLLANLSFIVPICLFAAFSLVVESLDFFLEISLLLIGL